MVASQLGARLPGRGDIVGGKYTIDAILGEGGMGAVFKARHMKLGNTVAIKVMRAAVGDPEAGARFINEGRNVVGIESEHVVRVFDVDEDRGYAYMVLEYLEGEDLGQVLERVGRLPPPVAVGYVLQALEGVAAAHERGVVHRDLKPANLYLARRKDGSTVVKVLDFGIAKKHAALGQSPQALTSTCAMLGSPLYMSPEQLRSSKHVNHLADVWAVGVILYELLTGHLPFAGEHLGELFAAILEKRPPPLRPLAPEVPAELEAIVFRCLERLPEARIQSARQLMSMLLPFATPSTGDALPMLGHPGNARPSSFDGTPESSAQDLGPMTTSGGGFGAQVTPPSGASSPIPRGTAPLGAAAPTQGAWQASGATEDSKETSGVSMAMVALGASIALALVGAVLAVYAFTARPRIAPALAASGDTTTSSPTSEPASAVTVLAAVGETAPPASASATTAGIQPGRPSGAEPRAPAAAPLGRPGLSVRSPAAPKSDPPAKPPIPAHTAAALPPVSPIVVPPAKPDSLNSDSRR